MPPLPYAVRRVFVTLPRPYKQGLAIAFDAFILLLSFQLALWFRFELFFFDHYYLLLSVSACIGGLAAFGALGLYRYVLRYMNERVVFSIAGGVLVSVMVTTAMTIFLQMPTGLSRGVLVIYALLAVVSLLSARVLARRALFPGTYHAADVRVPVAIYGAGAAGSQLLTALRAGPHYTPVALVDDDRRKRKLVIAGLRVHAPSDLPRLIERHQIQQLLIAIPSATPTQIRNIVEQVEGYRLRIRLVPSLQELVDSKGPRLRDVQVEDLLGRDPVAPVPELLERCVRGKSVFVSGAGGSIGSELCRQILTLQPRRLVLFEMSEVALYAIDHNLRQLNGDNVVEIISVLGSVRDYDRCLAQLRHFEIQTIYHAAAYKHVPIVEANVHEGIRTNTFGTLALARAAVDARTSDFVLISTDKAVRPTNVMGASKRLAELVLQAHAQLPDGPRFSMVRFGNVLGSSGSVVPLFHRQILAGGPITLTHPDITRYFMTIPEAAQLVLQAGAMGESGSVFVLDMGEPVRIRDLAVRMINMYGLTLRDADQPDGDIEIRTIGLRPGEKLYEELLIDAQALPTQHPRIMRAEEHALAYDALMVRLAQLDDAMMHDDQDQVMAILKEMVPGFCRQSPATIAA
ncbi:polysaccharide biosynthesis protein [Achromobacter xylosoxidans]|jgi:FlaA1/EpsC-like NDP-sugar epimerase|uniref:polysaccharide biosynthesis protein n=1 Tax=Achromobacter TaxID=222 RepID=UPI0006C5F2AF|nr:nucleoside-diphosphate sugar epimerase/dehydratase [Achromobacter xylosoxidans]MCM2570146.1 polysaccharide biosynthesis protein [Achromobacter xylosoxidans]WOB77163.1 nucleoside-diphosphate sugar epimerase/dehydratase [Achromobacter xylosoxidans]WPQ32759.1 nucleoside-diphosphate sugar epimerase/dehydratase [Achromobacter xylosoxidans]CUJ03915.1 UDP-glucose 4-epimerase [Achromobacter xylosoxidans]CUJ09171.1 UDP-glucose 4-epimerase [Achromobacter xylosoxidans]